VSLHEVVIIDEGDELTAGELDEFVALLTDGAVASGIDEGQPFDGVGEKPQLRLEGFRESPKAMQPLGNRWG
jgi:hypothetical protein